MRQIKHYVLVNRRNFVVGDEFWCFCKKTAIEGFSGVINIWYINIPYNIPSQKYRDTDKIELQIYYYI